MKDLETWRGKIAGKSEGEGGDWLFEGHWWFRVSPPLLSILLLAHQLSLFFFLILSLSLSLPTPTSFSRATPHSHTGREGDRQETTSWGKRTHGKTFRKVGSPSFALRKREIKAKDYLWYFYLGNTLFCSFFSSHLLCVDLWDVCEMSRHNFFMQRCSSIIIEQFSFRHICS